MPQWIPSCSPLSHNWLLRSSPIAGEAGRVTTAAAPHVVLSDLGPIAQLRAGRLSRRLEQLYAGLLLYGFSIALMVRAHLGLAPWDVLHNGQTKHLTKDKGQGKLILSEQ